MIPWLAVCAVVMEMVHCALRNYGQCSLVRYARQRFVGHEMDKEHMKCIVHRISNDFRIADSNRAAIVLSQGRLTLMDRFIPGRYVNGYATQQSIVGRRGDRCRTSKRVS